MLLCFHWNVFKYGVVFVLEFTIYIQMLSDYTLI